MRLADGFPFPDAAALGDAAAQFGALADGALVLVDGLAFGALPDLAEREAARLRLVALVHHPLAYETGLEPGLAARLLASERRALRAARAVLVTSPATARAVRADLGVPGERIGVALPGTAPRPRATGSGGAEVVLLAVGAVSPRKGFVALATALADLGDLPWRLDIAGSLERHPAAVLELEAALIRHALQKRVTLLGELDGAALEARYQTADLFVSAAAYEGYGMALAEAVAAGLPIVAVAGGAVGDWLDPGAALLVPPGDGAALRAALRTAIGDGRVRARLRAGAVAARAALPSWAETARAADVLLRAVLAE
jgi:glycosyltransferase involved in cell wall biosynthesis